MSKAVTGDFDALQQLIKQFETLATSLPQINQKAAQALQSTALSQFANAQGPNNEPWKPREDGQKALQKPASQITFTASPFGITEKVPDVLQYHQDTRPTVPQGQSLPAPWDQTLSQTYEKEISLILGQKI